MRIDKRRLPGEILEDFLAEGEKRSRDPSAVFFSSPEEAKAERSSGNPEERPT